jgi:hypothetical protein
MERDKVWNLIWDEGNPLMDQLRKLLGNMCSFASYEDAMKAIKNIENAIENVNY